MLREAVVGPRSGRAMAVFAVCCLLLITPMVSISVTFPVFLVYREGWRVENIKGRKVVGDDGASK